MSGRNICRSQPPQKLFEAFKDITNSNLIRNKELSDENIAQFENLLNTAQPQTDEDHCMRSFVQYLYRKNPGHFTRFIQRSHLNHLTLWTEAKFMVSVFELRGLVYIKWDIDANKYVCSMHRIVTEYLTSGKCSSMEEVVDRISRETTSYNRGPPRDFNDNRGDRDNRGPPRDNRGDRDNRGPPRDNRGPPRDNRGPPRDTRHNHDKSQNSNPNQARMYNNRRSRESNDRNVVQTPTETDFPILVSKPVFVQTVVWPKKGSVEPPATPNPSVNGSNSDSSSNDVESNDLTVSVFDINISDSVVAPGNDVL
jgi:hypothetical protein